VTVSIEAGIVFEFIVSFAALRCKHWSFLFAIGQSKTSLCNLLKLAQFTLNKWELMPLKLYVFLLSYVVFKWI